MDYSVHAYLTDAKKIEAVFGSKSGSVLEEIKAKYHRDLECCNDTFEDDITPQKDAFTVLSDIVRGRITCPELDFLYGYVYELVCKFYGKAIYSAPGLWSFAERSTFVPIPQNKGFPYIISIPASELESRKQKYKVLKKGQGIGDYDYEQEMDDLNFIFDEAVEAQKDLVIMVY